MLRFLLAALLLVPLAADAGLAKRTAYKQGAKGTNAWFTRYSRAVLRYGPVSYWPFDETSGTTVADITANAFNLTAGAAATRNIASLMNDGEGRSMEIDLGDTGNAERTDTDSLDIPASGTLVFWHSFASDCATLIGVFSRDDGAGTDRFVVYLGTAGTTLNVFSNGTTSTSSTITAGTHFWAVSWSGTTALFRMDGTAQGSATYAAPTASTAAVIVGHMNRGGSNEAGCNDEEIQGVGFFNVQLTADQIDSMWDAAR